MMMKTAVDEFHEDMAWNDVMWPSLCRTYSGDAHDLIPANAFEPNKAAANRDKCWACMMRESEKIPTNQRYG